MYWHNSITDVTWLLLHNSSMQNIPDGHNIIKAVTAGRQCFRSLNLVFRYCWKVQKSDFDCIQYIALSRSWLFCNLFFRLFWQFHCYVDAWLLGFPGSGCGEQKTWNTKLVTAMAGIYPAKYWDIRVLHLCTGNIVTLPWAVLRASILLQYSCLQRHARPSAIYNLVQNYTCCLQLYFG